MKPSVVIVTGASSGIGAETATLLAERGYTVVATARRATTLAGVARSSSRITAVSADIRSPDAPKQLLAQAMKLGRLRGVVHCAGAFKPAPVEKQKPADWAAMFDTNVTAAARLLQATAKALANGGVFIGISSTAGVRPVAGYTGYCASKGALNAYLQSAALELAPRGIRVHGIAPGIVATPMQPKAVEAALLHPLGRAGRPADVAQAVAYLLDPATEWMTGLILPVDGGISLT